MNTNLIFEFSIVLNHEKFHQLFSHLRERTQYLEENDDEYVDLFMAGKGVTAIYRDSQYKKKVKLTVDAGRMLNGDRLVQEKFLRKLDKRINEYFEYKYNLDDFSLSGLTLVADIDVKGRENVLAYLRVLQRIGRVKGFTQTAYECFDGIGNFCVDGNSNGITFQIYDLESRCKKLCMEDAVNRKKWKQRAKEAESILRAKVRLAKPKAVRAYTDKVSVKGQIRELFEKSQYIFLETFVRIIPFGDFYKKDKALEIIRKEVNDSIMRRRMFRLLVLIPEKKSLYLAQKAMNCRNVEKVMDAFAKINLSPVTISKRQDVKCLKNIYEYLCE